MSIEDGLAQLLSGGKRTVAKPQVQTAMEGVILDVFDTTATFSIPDFDPHSRFGPSAFKASSVPPKTGDRCLVIFVGNGVDRSWIVSWIAAE